jgi:hypothetical protein
MRLLICAMLLAAACQEAPVFLDVITPADTDDTQGPYTVTAVLQPDWPLRRVELVQAGSIEDCIFQAQRECGEEVEGSCQEMQEVSGDIFQASIVGQEAGTTTYFVIRAVAQGGEIAYFPEIREGGEPGSFTIALP